MKKIILALSFIFICGLAISQTLDKGNLIGIHVQEISLNSDVTLDQYLDFFKNTYLPAVNENFPGMETSLAKGINGEGVNRIAVFYFFDSVESRNMYFKDDGTLTKAGQAANAKGENIERELSELGTSTFVYTDWLIE